MGMLFVRPPPALALSPRPARSMLLKRLAVIALAAAAACADGPTAASGDPTAAALAAAIRDAGGQAMVGFKEAGQARGVDPQGRNLVRAETVARMQALLRERGLVIEATGGDLPYVVARFPSAERAQVAALLAHPNVDYVEAATPGTYH